MARVVVAVAESPLALWCAGPACIVLTHVTCCLRVACRVPAYYALILRSLTVLEGLALQADPQYKLLGRAYPYIAKRLLTGEYGPLAEWWQGRVGLERNHAAGLIDQHGFASLLSIISSTGLLCRVYSGHRAHCCYPWVVQTIVLCSLHIHAACVLLVPPDPAPELRASFEDLILKVCAGPGG